MAKKSAHEIRIGRIKAVIWANETAAGIRHNVQLQRIYRPEGSEEWQTSDSFGRDDLLVVAKVADMAHSWIYEQRQSAE